MFSSLSEYIVNSYLLFENISCQKVKKNVDSSQNG
nr:MAG TPA: hypothetical protein [Bacteriophage sp.]